ncbi:MAG: GIY-YIG nuclease family protein [Chloroflexota bacterium]
MAEKDRRRDLTAAYKRTHPEAGVYRIVNTTNGKALLSSALNLNSVRSKVAFARSTGTAGGLPHQLEADIRKLGIDAFSLEILEVLETRPEQTAAEVRADLTALEELWREKLDPATLY